MARVLGSGTWTVDNVCFDWDDSAYNVWVCTGSSGQVILAEIKGETNRYIKSDFDLMSTRFSQFSAVTRQTSHQGEIYRKNLDNLMDLSLQ